MYLEHFGLREAPFLITPHTEFFFAGANRGATLEALIYAITHDEGIVKISGEVGSGKTMLCRMLLEKLPENVVTVYLANPSLSREEILFAIAEELGVALPVEHTHLRMRALQDRLLDIYSTGRKVVVMVDEAHAMPPNTLEEIRLLSNLETNRHKLLHIVLFGQPELDVHLSNVNMRQLKERITHNFALEPLHRGDIENYLMFRIRAAGYRGPDLFTSRAIQLISKASEGLTRRINILADKAMLAAFSENKHHIDAKQIKAAIRDAQFNPMRERKKQHKPWAFGVATVLAVATLAYLAGRLNSSKEEPSEANPVSVESSSAIPVNGKKPSNPQAVHEETQNAVAMSVEGETPTLAERISATEEWLRKTPDSHYFIQLLSTDGSNLEGVEQFIESHNKLLDQLQIRVYRSSLSGRDRLGIIYGDFTSREAAADELAKLNKAIPSTGPYIRSVRKLR